MKTNPSAQKADTIDPKHEAALGKPQILKFPKCALIAFDLVRRYGETTKYWPDSWKNNEDGVTEYLNAAGRHILDVGDGEILDPESGLPHVYHVLANAVFAVWHYEQQKKK